MVEIEWSPEAVKDIEKLDKQIARRVVRKITWLAENYDHIVPEPLTGEFKGTYKLRVGDYRVVYTLKNKIIVIQFIGHRKRIYKGK